MDTQRAESDPVLDTDTTEREFLQAYWDDIDRDPEVQKRREKFERAVAEGRVPEGAVYPTDYLREREDRLRDM